MDNFMLIAILFFLLFAGCLLGYWRITGAIIKDQEEEIKRLKRENEKLKSALKRRRLPRQSLIISSAQSNGFKDEISKALYSSRGLATPSDIFYGDF